jgi:hypothetical protein
MRFPKSWLAPDESSPMATKLMGGLVGFGVFAFYAFTAPNFVVVVNIFLSAFVAYVLASYAVSLTVERRRAHRLGLPEPGTDGAVSTAEGVVSWAISIPFAAAALFLTVYGISSAVSGNRGEGVTGLGLGAVAWLIAVAMGLYGFVTLRWQRPRGRRRGTSGLLPPSV